MSDLDSLSVADAKEIHCLRCNRLVNIAGTRDKLLIALVHHLSEDHENVPIDVILEGEDFTILNARLRCDLCMAIAKPPYLTYLTPGAPVQDERWLICPDCSTLIEDPFGHKLERLTERSLRQQLSMLVTMPEDQARAGIRASMNTFLTYKRGAPTKGMS